MNNAEELYQKAQGFFCETYRLEMEIHNAYNQLDFQKRNPPPPPVMGPSGFYMGGVSYSSHMAQISSLETSIANAQARLSGLIEELKGIGNGLMDCARSVYRDIEKIRQKMTLGSTGYHDLEIARSRASEEARRIEGWAQDVFGKIDSAIQACQVSPDAIPYGFYQETPMNSFGNSNYTDLGSILQDCQSVNYNPFEYKSLNTNYQSLTQSSGINQIFPDYQAGQYSLGSGLSRDTGMEWIK